MTVSALMACYNRKEYVEKAVESIEKQLSEEDELLISDDCSTDGTSEFIDALSEKYKNIKVFHQRENLGWKQKKHGCEYKVVLLDKDNFNRYIDIPKNIKDKLDKGLLAIQNFSDYFLKIIWEIKILFLNISKYIISFNSYINMMMKIKR